MVLLLKGEVQPLNFFIDSMAAANGEIEVLDITREDFMDSLMETDSRLDSESCVVLFNNIGMDIYYGDQLYWKMKRVRVYNILVDHPINYLSAIVLAFPELYLLTIDRKHREFIRCNFPMFPGKSYFLPHGGSDLGLHENEERDIDVIYMGTRYWEKDMQEENELLGGQSAEFYRFCYEYYINEKSFQAEEIVDLYIRLSNRKFTDEERLILIGLAVTVPEKQAMLDLKVSLMRSLLQAGIHIEFHGTKWEELKAEYPDYVTIGEKLSPEDCIAYMGRAKISLNMQPVFTDGGHERVFNSMLNGAVCVSNYSRYLEERFTDGEDIIFVDFSHLEETVSKIKMILSDPALQRRIRNNAYEKVQGDTWKCRLEQIVRGEFDET